MIDKVIKPKCPQCGRVQADWTRESQFTCPRCGLTFIIGKEQLSIFLDTPLTNSPKGANN